MQETLQKAHMLKDCVQSLVSAGKCGLGKEKEEVNHHCTIKKKKVPDKPSGQIQDSVTDLCTQTSGDRVVCALFHYPQPKLPKACFTQEELFDQGHRGWPCFNTDFCETICSRGKTCKTGEECKVNMWVNWRVEWVSYEVPVFWSLHLTAKQTQQCSVFECSFASKCDNQEP